MLKDLFFPRSPEAAQTVFDDARAAGLYVALIGGLQFPRWVYHDFVNKIPLGFALQVGAVAACLIGAFAARKPLTPLSRHVFNMANVLLVLIQVEVRLNAPDVPFSYLFPWVTFPIIVLLDAILFQGSPAYFCAVWLSALAFYETRIYFHAAGSGVDPHAVAVLQLGAVALIVVCSVINVFWFYIRYKNAVQKREIARLREESLREATLRAEAEQQLVLLQERERVSADFHNHLSGSLAELQTFLGKREEQGQRGPDGDWGAVDRMVASVVQSFKNVLHDYRA